MVVEVAAEQFVYKCFLSLTFLKMEYLHKARRRNVPYEQIAIRLDRTPLACRLKVNGDKDKMTRQIAGNTRRVMAVSTIDKGVFFWRKLREENLI